MSSHSIKNVILCGETFEFLIIPKKNLHTYFYFRNGRVTVNKAKRMSMAQLMSYVKTHEASFYKRIKQSIKYQSTRDTYYLFGQPYTSLPGQSKAVVVDHTAKTIQIPSDTALKQYEKSLLLKELDALKEVFLSNPYIAINDITFRVSPMKSRHGSCQPRTGKIHINQNLVHAPKDFLRYVFCHEITHLKVPNHSRSFYTLLEKICPDYQEIRQALKQG